MGALYSRSQSAAGPSQVVTPAYDELLLKLEQRRIEREIALIQAIQERKAALKLAEAREALKWSVPTGLLTIAMTVVASYKHKNLLHLVPVFPIAGYLSYQVNSCYGTKREIVLDESEKIFAESGAQLVPEPISTTEVRERIAQMREDATSYS
ncbi:hypothetical protein QR680_000860 [Steinernema hermaphroditum]|uniref:Plasminogen receptor (KT) n=1 Tax=Steinernema hermaphroditum TaxID=289476 RepID=A0AA39GY45_9BILA|nr:hypothetical protein QR680_000860 [Steinernema hermaphroditum]